MAENGPRIVALVPMRHWSERVPGKNYRPLAGRPLYAYILDTLSDCPEVDEIVVDTDSPEIKSGVEDRFPHVNLLDRPDHLIGGEIPMNDVLVHDVLEVEADFYLQTHSTNPLLSAETVRRGIRIFLEGFPEFDSLFSVTRMQTRLWSDEGAPLNHDPAELLRTQDLTPVYEENSCLYLFERERFLQRQNRIGRNPMMFEVDRSEAWDIDEELDFQMVECLVEIGQSRPNSVEEEN